MAVPALPANTNPLASAAEVGSLAGAMRVSEINRLAPGARVVHAPNPPFFLRHHARGWDIGEVDGEVAGVKLSGSYWLPEMALFVIQPGAGGCRTRNKSEEFSGVYDRAVRNAREAGWNFIDPSADIPTECLPVGVPAGGYLRELPCVDPRTGAVGIFHCEAWNVPTLDAPGEPHRLVFERARHNRWRAWLVLTGQVHAPSAAVLGAIATRLHTRVERAELLQVPEEIRKRRVDAATAVETVARKATLPGKKEAPAAQVAA